MGLDGVLSAGSGLEDMLLDLDWYDEGQQTAANNLKYSTNIVAEVAPPGPETTE